MTDNAELQPAAEPGVTFAKKSKNRGNLRKRPAEADGPDAGVEGPAVVRKVKSAKDSSLAFTTKREGDKAAAFTFSSDRRLQQQTDQGATRTNEAETEHDRDGRALREAVLRQQAEGAPSASGTYQGMNNYKDYRAGFRRENTIANEKGSGVHGPLRASANVRMTVRFDYQPDICKDYKETGFCGYGDSCKFVHDRSDYKSGWEIEREWEAQQKERQKKILEGWDPDNEKQGESGEEDEDELPFACYICRRPWEECQDPVVTRCRHYFCEQCALKHNATSSKCFVCDTPTAGIFNVAHDILKRVKAKKSA